jgi:hypothetical protein
MIQMHNRRQLFTLVLSTAALAAAPAAAQDFTLPPAPAKSLSLEGVYTDFEGVDVGFPSTVWFLTGRAPLTPTLGAVVDLPFSYAKVDAGLDEESSSVFGNPYVGIEYAAMPSLKLELGGRLPLTSADDESFADLVAIVANPMRAEAFVSDLVPVTAAATLTRELSPSFSLRGRAGATEFFYTGDEADADNETSLDYGLAGTYTSGNARLGLGLSGRWLASADEGDFGENSFHFIGGSVDVLVHGVRPGLTVRLPLDGDYSDAVKSSVGLYLQVPVR